LGAAYEAQIERSVGPKYFQNAKGHNEQNASRVRVSSCVCSCSAKHISMPKGSWSSRPGGVGLAQRWAHCTSRTVPTPYSHRTTHGPTEGPTTEQHLTAPQNTAQHRKAP